MSRKAPTYQPKNVVKPEPPKAPPAKRGIEVNGTLYVTVDQGPGYYKDMLLSPVLTIRDDK
jgi:hypothetical protein